MSVLLGYVMKHTEECYDVGLTPRKPLILILFGLMCLGLVAIAVMKLNLKSNGIYPTLTTIKELFFSIF